ncbi:hypothetical protein ScPMuIL_017781 [Solemya velum]
MCDGKVIADVRADLEKSTADQATVGHSLFLAFFKSKPERQDMFPKYKGRPISDLEKDETLKAHGGAVMEFLANFINSVDDSEVIKIMSQEFADLHRRFYIPHSAIAGTKGQVILTFSKYGMDSQSWPAFLDYFFKTIEYELTERLVHPNDRPFYSNVLSSFAPLLYCVIGAIQ